VGCSTVDLVFVPEFSNLLWYWQHPLPAAFFDANAVREFAFQGRLGQWNTVEILQTSTLEEALTRVQELETIY
jgi:hypothetical protein